MSAKKIIAILIFIAGLVLIFISHYIKIQVAEGKIRVESAQSQVDQGNSLFSITPETKALGKSFTGSAQSQINEGTQKIALYAGRADILQVTGIILLVLGIGIFFVRLGRK